MSTIHSNHSLQSVTPLINRLVDDLVVKILPAVRTLSLRSSTLEIGMQYTLCCRAPILRSQPGSSQGCWGRGHTDDSIKFGTVRCRNSTVDFTRCDGAPSCWNTKWSPDFWVLTNFWEKTSLQQRFSVVACIYLGSFLDKMNKWTDVLPALNTATDASL